MMERCNAVRLACIWAAMLIIIVAVAVTDPKNEEDTVKTQHAGDKAADAGKEGSESWAEWAKDKISEGLGLGTEKAKDTAKQASDATIDAAKKTKEKVTDTAYGAGQYTAEKTGDIKDAATNAHGKVAEKADEVKEKVAEKAEQAKEKAAEIGKGAADEAKMMASDVGWDKKKAKEGFETTKETLASNMDKAHHHLKDEVANRDEEL